MNDTLVSAHEDLEAHVKMDSSEPTCELHRTRGRTLRTRLLVSVLSMSRVAKRDKWARNIGNKASTKDPKPTLSDVTWLSSKPYISSKARRISNEKEETIRNKRKISTGQENGLCTEVEQHRKESKQLRSVVAKQKKSKKVDLKVDTQMAQQKVQPNDSNAVELDIVHCVCGTTSRDGMIMQCDSCSAWQHGKCFGVTDPTTLPSRYLCQACVNGRRVWASHSYKQAAFRTLSDGWLPPFTPVDTIGSSKHFANLARISNVLFRLRDMLHAIDLRVQKILEMGSPADETYGRLAAEAVDAARVQWAMDACETVLRKSERETEIRHPPIIIGKDDTGIQLKAADIVKDLGIVQQLILYSTIKCDSPAERGWEKERNNFLSQ
ncbi:SET domain-containing protein 4-like isoform X3 [Varroa destructor]|nr:SET domain-containing protein 4-like isoform X3 [Varroa destructor]XP_022647523.1 SET domain-containing protein 4-like isoform X3 [Varroa destructor]